MLAIAAVKLGARSAVGIDIDPDALENARENSGLNQMGDRVRFEEGDFREMAAGADVVMANLTGGLLERSAEALAAMIAPDGFLIISGFMESEKAAVVPALERFLNLQAIAQEEEWMCATYRTAEAKPPPDARGCILPYQTRYRRGNLPLSDGDISADAQRRHAGPSAQSKSCRRPPFWRRAMASRLLARHDHDRS